PDSRDEEADNPPTPWQRQHPHDPEFKNEGCDNRSRMEPVRQMLGVPANPGWQRAILVVLIHGREVAPLDIVTEQLYRAGLKVDAKPLPLKQEQTCARWRTGSAQPWPESRGSEEQRYNPGFEQHAIRLIT